MLFVIFWRESFQVFAYDHGGNHDAHAVFRQGSQVAPGPPNHPLLVWMGNSLHSPNDYARVNADQLTLSRIFAMNRSASVSFQRPFASSARRANPSATGTL